MKILQQGAEAMILLDKDRVIKRRIKKSYRIPELDKKIRLRRTKSESKLLEKASKVIPVPEVLEDSSGKGGRLGSRKGQKEIYQIKMQFIDGKKLSEYLDRFPLKKQKEILREIGKNIANLHDENIIHGDLTTSNMIYIPIDVRGKIFFIDFGLGFISQKVEDKAVDLHLLKEALEAKHFRYFEELFNEIIEGYKISKNSEKVLQQFKKVEKRGRYKKQY